MESPIYDYNFSKNERAQYVYIDHNDSDALALVKIIDIKSYPDSKRYIVSIHSDILKKTDLQSDVFLNDHYATELEENHSAVYVYPDELVPFFRQFSVVVDNTKTKGEY